MAFALLLPGCSVSLGAGDTAEGAVGAHTVRLLVTRDFGAQVLLDRTTPYQEGMTAMSLLASAAAVETGYGGGFVGAIDGLASTFGKSGASPPHDWFYWIDGSLGEVGAADNALAAEQTVSWDYHQWSGAAMIQSTLAAFPRPFSAEPVQVVDSGSAALLRTWLTKAGIEMAAPVDGAGPAAAEPPGPGHAAAAFTLEADLPPWVLEVLQVGARAGVFAQVDGGHLSVLTEAGVGSGRAEAVALAVRNPATPESLIFLLLASDPASLEAFLQRVSPEDVRGYVGLYMWNGEVRSLPAGAGS